MFSHHLQARIRVGIRVEIPGLHVSHVVIDDVFSDRDQRRVLAQTININAPWDQVLINRTSNVRIDRRYNL